MNSLRCLGLQDSKRHERVAWDEHPPSPPKPSEVGRPGTDLQEWPLSKTNPKTG